MVRSHDRCFVQHPGAGVCSRLRGGRLNFYLRERTGAAAAAPPLAKASRSIFASSSIASRRDSASSLRLTAETACMIFVAGSSISVDAPAEAAAFAAARQARRHVSFRRKSGQNSWDLAARRPTILTSCQAADPLARRPSRRGRLELHGGTPAARRSLRIFRQSRRLPCRGEAGM